MAIFSNSDEKELAAKRQEMDKLVVELERREADLSNREERNKQVADELKEKREADTKLFQSEREKLSSWEQRLVEQEQSVELEKAKAKAGFADQQRDSFKEYIDKRTASLDERQKDIDQLEKEMASRLKAHAEHESDVARREQEVLERELKADAGFAEKLRHLEEQIEIRKKECELKDQELQLREEALQKQSAAIEQEKEKLRSKAEQLQLAESEREAGYADLRQKLDEELHQARTEAQEKQAQMHREWLAAHEKEMESLRKKMTSEIEVEVAKRREDSLREMTEEREAHKSAIANDLESIKVDTAQLNERRSALDAQEQDLAYRESLLEARDENLRSQEDEQEQRVDELVVDRRRSFEREAQTLNDEISRLRDSLQQQTTLLGYFEELKSRLGNKEPEEVIHDLNLKSQELKTLREELANRPAAEIQQRIDDLERQKESYKAQVDELQAEAVNHRERLNSENIMRGKLNEAEATIGSLRRIAESHEAAANKATAELNRLRSSYDRPAEVAARYSEIEMPHIKAKDVKKPEKNSVDEVEWLNRIEQECESYGLHFNSRIIKAFHTSLKTAEWSPLSVLAGVSGTGKSELPRLYSHFGGLYYEPLSVQPNWDSQESMLGFFNSIDNKFDAQPLLRFLAQSQQTGGETYDKRLERWQEMAGNSLLLDPNKDADLIDDLKAQEYPGLKDAMCLVLLDEMNLAHPELYFAEFLSKLELRRGRKRLEVPRLPVKVGAGLPPYQLPLGRNVLWAGTMNQDETTKSLSDKVLDRATVIHFPRPDNLKRREKLSVLDAKNRGKLLHRSDWESWLTFESSFSEKEFAPYKRFIEDINESIGEVGRAVGHRVLQTIEYYMSNYPDVRASRIEKDDDALQAALHDAFEDQLVQKVMPKLRGIDTRERSKGKDCLQKILDLLEAGIGKKRFNLREDFEQAMELGYGQFMWQSANYLKESSEETKEEDKADKSEAANSEKKKNSKA